MEYASLYSLERAVISMFTLVGLAVAAALNLPVTTTVSSPLVTSTDAIVALVNFPGEQRPNIADAQAMLDNLNTFRQEHHLRPLIDDPQLDHVAQVRGENMLVQRYIGHVSPDGKTPYDSMKTMGISYSWAGENLALDENEPAAFTALVQSPDHEANMLESHYGHIGIAAIRTENTGTLFIQEFTN